MERYCCGIRFGGKEFYQVVLILKQAISRGGSITFPAYFLAGGRDSADALSPFPQGLLQPGDGVWQELCKWTNP
jgi:hypothetical protein